MRYNIITSPVYCLGVGYLYIAIVAIAFYKLNFFGNHSFFTWGPPLSLFGKIINDNSTFYIILSVYFFHQLINNWVNNVTYPWIINCVQDSKCLNTGFSNPKTLFIVNLFAIYSNLDLLFIIGGATSQISFFLVIIIANIISTTLVNLHHIKIKDKEYANLII